MIWLYERTACRARRLASPRTATVISTVTAALWTNFTKPPMCFGITKHFNTYCLGRGADLAFCGQFSNSRTTSAFLDHFAWAGVEQGSLQVGATILGSQKDGSFVALLPA